MSRILSPAAAESSAHVRDLAVEPFGAYPRPAPEPALDTDITVEGPPLRIPPEIGAAPTRRCSRRIGLADGLAQTLTHHRR
jgi:hypothetical protein